IISRGFVVWIRLGERQQESCNHEAPSRSSNANETTHLCDNVPGACRCRGPRRVAFGRCPEEAAQERPAAGKQADCPATATLLIADARSMAKRAADALAARGARRVGEQGAPEQQGRAGASDERRAVHTPGYPRSHRP